MGLCHAAQQAGGKYKLLAVCCDLRPRPVQAGSKRMNYRQLAQLDSALSSPGSFCILTPCSLIVIQLCQAALSAFQLSFTAQGCVLQGTGQAVSTVAGRHRCGFDSD